MKIDRNYKLRKVAGETIIVNQGNTNTDLTNIISFNSTSELMWNEFHDKDFSTEDVIDFLIQTYGIDKEKATQDGNYWIDKLKECKLIIE